MTTYHDHEEKAEAIESILNSYEDRSFKASVSHEGGYSRIHVSRKLSKGMQNMGYIEVEDGDDDINYKSLSRAKATIRDIVEAEI